MGFARLNPSLRATRCGGWRGPRAAINRAERGVASGHFFLDNASYFRLLRAILLIESRGTLLETIPEAEQARFPRAGLVTPRSGGPGIVPAGITTGERGAPLKRARWRG
jgi:hypothetical protein